MTRDHAGARAAGLLFAFIPSTTDTAASAETMIMRATRLARAEVITAGRTGYAEAVVDAIAGDPDYVCRFTTDADPCPPCVGLAAETFETFGTAPSDARSPKL